MRKWYFYSKKTEEMNNHNNTNPHFSRPIFFFPLFLRYSSFVPPYQTRWSSYPEWYLHRLCTEFAPTLVRRKSGVTTELQRRQTGITPISLWEQTDDFSCYQNNWCSDDYNQPIHYADRLYVEECRHKVHDCYLSKEDNCRNSKESFASF